MLTTEKKVGLFFLAALITLGVMIELVQDWSPFEERKPFVAYFESAIGLLVGDPVRLAGVDVGKIQKIGIEGEKVRIDFYVVDGTSIKSDTVAAIRQTNLLGGQFLGLTFGSAEASRLEAGGVVMTHEGSNIDQLIDSFNRNQQEMFEHLNGLIAESRQPIVNLTSHLNNITRKIDDGEGTLGRIVNDASLYDDLQGAARGLKSLLVGLERGEGSLGRLMQDPALYDEALATVGNLRLITDELRAGQGTLGRLLTDTTLYDNANEALGGFREIMAKANRGEGTLGLLVNDEALYREATGALTHINSIAGKINQGQGTLARLVNEDDLYREAKTTLHKVEKTVDGMSDSGPLSALGVVIGTFF
ncbi:MAG: MCE family protein [Desulfuromonas sp.]|nr:MAG: MCE family protein [Desulfuromonas sp.]